MENTVPKLLFKFRALTTKTDLIRLVDILENNRLFFPTRKNINDPFELGRTTIQYGGYMGAWQYLQYQREEPMVSEKRERYHFLSLSEDCFSPQLWAYYADTYTGVCLCYSTEKSFRMAKPVVYSSEQRALSEYDDCIDSGDSCEYDFDEKVDRAIEEDVFSKQKEWEHEKEWRIAQKDGDKYFTYEEDELVGIIIGYNMDPETRAFLLKRIPSMVKVLLVRPQMFANRLATLEYGDDIFEAEATGEPLNFIDTSEALYEYLTTGSTKADNEDDYEVTPCPTSTS